MSAAKLVCSSNYAKAYRTQKESQLLTKAPSTNQDSLESDKAKIIAELKTEKLQIEQEFINIESARISLRKAELKLLREKTLSE